MEYEPHHLKVVGSSPAIGAGTGRKIIAKMNKVVTLVSVFSPGN